MVVVPFNAFATPLSKRVRMPFLIAASFILFLGMKIDLTIEFIISDILMLRALPSGRYIDIVLPLIIDSV